MIAVLGATGRVGSLVAGDLAQRGAAAFAISREPQPRTALQTRRGDLTDLASMRRALEGASRVFLLTPHTPEQPLLEANALAACREARVERIVKISGGPGTLGPNGTTPTSVAHWNSEQAIERSGLGFTFLRPSFFAQNLLEMIAPVTAALGVLPRPFGRAAIAMVDVRDIAACAAAALLDPDPVDAAWSITGPRAVTFDAIAEHLGLRTVPTTAFMRRRALQRRGAAPSEIDHATRMAAYLAAGGDAVTTDHVEQLTGRPARPVERLLDEHAAAFAPTGAAAKTLTSLLTKEHR